MISVERKNVEETKLFIEHGADYGFLGATEIWWLASQIRNDESWQRIFDLCTKSVWNHLLKSSVMNSLNYNGPMFERFPVMRAIDSKTEFNQIQQLIEKNELVSSDRLCELVIAIKSGRPELVRYFVELGANVNSLTQTERAC